MTAHPIDTEALRRLSDHATPGPWEAEAANGGVFHVAVHPYPEGSVALDAKQADAEFIAAAREAIPALLDALAATEARATRAEAQSAIRGRAVIVYRERAREAETRATAWEKQYTYDTDRLWQELDDTDARIKAVQGLIDQADTAGDWAITCSRLQWAIDGTPTIEHREAQ